MNHWVIKKMEPSDLPEVCAIERNIFSEPWSENGFLSALNSKDTIYLSVKQEDRIVAYCGLLQSFDEADITNVAVAEDARRQGIAEAMLRELLCFGQERGIERYTLEVRASNTGAIRLYEKLGFTSVGIRKRFYAKPVEDAVIMWTGQEEQ